MSVLIPVQAPPTGKQDMPEGADGVTPRHGTLGVDWPVPPRQVVDRCHPVGASAYSPRQVPRLTSCGSQAGDQCPKKWGISLLRLVQIKIFAGLATVAQIWISGHLISPHALQNFVFTHPVLS